MPNKTELTEVAIFPKLGKTIRAEFIATLNDAIIFNGEIHEKRQVLACRYSAIKILVTATKKEIENRILATYVINHTEAI